MFRELLNNPEFRGALEVLSDRLDEYVQQARERGVSADAIARAKSLATGELLLSLELEKRERDEPVRTECPNCGDVVARKQRRTRSIITVVGPITYKRSVYHCKHCKETFAPLDREFGLIEGCDESRALRELHAFLYAGEPCEAVKQNVEKTLGFTVSTSTVHQVARLEGERAEQRFAAEAEAASKPEALEPLRVPWAGPSTGLRQGKVGMMQADGYMNKRRDLPDDAPSSWSETKLGLITDLAARIEKPPSDREVERAEREGRVPRGREVLLRKAYVSSSRSRDEFKERLWAEALRWQLHTAEVLLVLGDGAPWIWNIASELFGELDAHGATADKTQQRIEILDWKHAEKHINEIATLIYGSNPKGKQMSRRLCKRLWEQGDAAYISRLFARLATRPTYARMKADLERESKYFAKNTQRCAYPTFRNAGHPISSGAIEGACGSFGQARSKQPGMSWDIDGLSGCLALRTYRENDRWLELFPDAALPRAA